MTQEELTILENLDLDSVYFDVEADEEEYLEVYNTFLQFLEDKDEDIIFWVHEYLTPRGSRGYQVFFKYIIGEKEFIKSIGYGDEEDSRTLDWQEIILNEE